MQQRSNGPTVKTCCNNLEYESFLSHTRLLVLDRATAASGKMCCKTDVCSAYSAKLLRPQIQQASAKGKSGNPQVYVRTVYDTLASDARIPSNLFSRRTEETVCRGATCVNGRVVFKRVFAGRQVQWYEIIDSDPLMTISCL